MNQVFLTLMTTFLIKHHWVLYFIPLIFGILAYNRLDKGLKLIFYYLIFGLFCEILNYIFVGTVKVSNSMPIGHFYYIVSSLILGLYYLEQLKGFIKREFIIIPIILFEVFALVNAFFIEGIFAFPSLTGALSSLIFIVFSVLLYSKILIEAKIKKLQLAPEVWINSAVLILYTSHLFYFALFNIILNYSYEFSKITIQFKTIINALFYQAFTVAFLLANKNEVTKN